LCSSGPAQAFGLHPQKGALESGADADVTIVDVASEKKVTADLLQSYSDYSLYEDRVLKGWPVMTIVGGQIMMDGGKIVGAPGHARYLARDAKRRR
jgi:dihydropyrimidinase